MMFTSAETRIRRFNIEAYHRLIDAGILYEDDRIELIEGRIVDMTSIGSRQSACVKRLNNLLTQMLQRQVIVSVQDPVQLDEESEPEPDIALLKYREDFYADKLPEAEDILLIIEVADTSLEYDIETKIPLYARAGIQEIWLVNLIENHIEIYLSPSADGYKTKTVSRDDQLISPLSFPNTALSSNQILGI